MCLLYRTREATVASDKRREIQSDNLLKNIVEKSDYLKWSEKHYRFWQEILTSAILVSLQSIW
jgi:hypothetical protein